MTMVSCKRLMLMVLLAFAVIVRSQPTTNDEDVQEGEEGLMSGLHRDMERLLMNQQQLLEQHETLMNRLESLDASHNIVRPRHCLEVYKSGEHSDGVYTIYVGRTQRPLQVYCDMTTDGGGWTVVYKTIFCDNNAIFDVFQRRKDGSVDFYLGWTDYDNGFGNLSGEFWLGNYNLHLLTSGERQKLRVDLADFDGYSAVAAYDDFEVGSARTKFKLVSLGAYAGTAGDGLSTQLGQKFSTKDQDNDVWSRACAVEFKGAWWYSNCHDSNLNGQYLNGSHASYADGVNWKHWKGQYYSLRFTEMKIRPF